MSNFDHEELLKDLEDEIDGVHKYANMAHNAETSVDRAFFHAMARDEHSHAKVIMRKLSAEHVEIPSELMDKYEAIAGFH